MVKFTGLLSGFEERSILVIGDLILDTYTIGRAERISPEAPVAVVLVKQEETRAGGAGNVALNLVALGSKVKILGRVGADARGPILTHSLWQDGVDVSSIIVQNGWTTPLKNRIIAGHQQIVRVDSEETGALPHEVEKEIVERLPQLFEGVKVIAISDYGKGFLTDNLLRQIFYQARCFGIPVITDPKGVEFHKYMGTTVIKPNLKEAYSAVALPSKTPLDVVAKKILNETKVQALVITRSEDGSSLFLHDGTHYHLPARVREVNDVTGAGDTGLAMLACAMANGLSYFEAVSLSNIASGIAVEKFGCAHISLSELVCRLLEEDEKNKIFEEHHLFTLQHALQDKEVCLLALCSQSGLTPALFKVIRQLSDRSDELLIYLRDEQPDHSFVELLASLKEVRFIILKGESLVHLCKVIRPNAVYLFERELIAVAKMEELIGV